MSCASKRVPPANSETTNLDIGDHIHIWDDRIKRIRHCRVIQPDTQHIDCCPRSCKCAIESIFHAIGCKLVIDLEAYELLWIG